MKDINLLPIDCFYNILQFLPIDDRIRARQVFSKFDCCFEKSLSILKTRKALAIDTISVSSPIDRKINRLCKRFNLFERWNCSDFSHFAADYFSNSDILTEKCQHCDEIILLCILDKCSFVESLDLRGVYLNSDLINGVVKYCPNLNCVKLNFVSFSEESLDLFIECICPNLKHLSCDNLFITNKFDKIFQSSSNLEQLEIILFPVNHLVPSDFLFLNSPLKFLSVQFYVTDKSTLSFCLPDYFTELKRGNATNILYLKVKSNYKYTLNYELFVVIKEFEKLKALNFSFMNFYNSMLNYDVQNCWPELESLTIDFYELKGSNSLLSIYLNRTYNYKLTSLRLMACILLNRTLENMPVLCPNLTCLQLIDISFKDVEKAFGCFRSLSNLVKLYIEYTFSDDYPSMINQDELNQMIEHHQFPLHKIECVRLFLSCHHNIKKVYIIDWPGLNSDNICDLRNIARDKNIYFYFREYNM